VRAAAAELLDLADDRFVRTIIAIGHPTADARAYRLPPGEARLPADELISWLPRTPSSPRAVPRS
jgi:hypothetical protein